MNQARRYSYSVAYDPEDEIYVASVAEFSMEAAHGESPEEALQGAVVVVETALELLKEEGREIPEPYPTQEYSGKVLLRMATSLHRALALEAKQEGVSLNQLLNLKLSTSLAQLTQVRQRG